MIFINKKSQFIVLKSQHKPKQGIDLTFLRLTASNT